MFRKFLAIAALLFLCLNALTPIAYAEAIAAPTWHYDAVDLSETWGKDYPQCAVGTEQSPVNLGRADFNSELPVTLDYATNTFEVVNNGHSIQVNYPAGSTATIDRQAYNLLQFHFHTPSEHRINREQAEMEIHFVHSNEAGDIAVIGAMIEAGAENDEISKIWRNIPAQGQSQQVDLAIHPENLLPESRHYAIYAGSLTTPPCTEGVTWVLMADSITFSSEQIKTFQTLYPMNARPIQRDKEDNI